jgi:hypothetical protein
MRMLATTTGRMTTTTLRIQPPALADPARTVEQDLLVPVVPVVPVVWVGRAGRAGLMGLAPVDPDPVVPAVPELADPDPAVPDPAVPELVDLVDQDQAVVPAPAVRAVRAVRVGWVTPQLKVGPIRALDLVGQVWPTEALPVSDQVVQAVVDLVDRVVVDRVVPVARQMGVDRVVVDRVVPVARQMGVDLVVEVPGDQVDQEDPADLRDQTRLIGLIPRVLNYETPKTFCSVVSARFFRPRKPDEFIDK